MPDLRETSDAARIIKILRQHMPELRRQYQVKSLGIFGSYVRNEQNKKSDLDLLVEFYEVPSLLELMKFENDLTALLDVKVDLVMKDALKPAIGTYINNEVVLV